MASDAITWFRHDITAMQDQSMRKLLRNYGPWGVGVYWMLIELVASNNGTLHIADDEDMDVLVEAMHIETGRDGLGGLLKDLADWGLIDKGRHDNRLIESPRMSRNLTEMRDAHNRRVSAGRKGGASRKNPQADES